MEISIFDLKNGMIKEKSVEDSIFLESGNFEHEIFENPKFDVTVHLKKDYSGIWLNMKYSGEIRFSCDRCLSESSIFVEDDFDTNLLEELDEELGSIFIDDNTIDMDKLLYDVIYTSLPSRMLCSEDCAGLCSGCGANLNLETCKCKEDDIDPRLMKLKSLL